jgi:protein-L-isoaspartate(D-aspartate) O-methyltransferase
MVERHLKPRGIVDERVLAAMRKVPRHEFIHPEYREKAYSDSALPIAEGQTISQPYIVALMTESARLAQGDRVLEVGTGSAYQAAVLAEMAAEVYTIEINETLARRAKERLARLGYANVHARPGDGYLGWPEAAPFDAILITAAAPRIPEPLLKQLKVGGRLVMPLGENPLAQELVVLTKTDHGIEREVIAGVVFVPMTGAVRK